MHRRSLAFALFISVMLQSACASLPPITGGVLPGADVRAHQPIYVLREPQDSHGLDQVIVRELREHGFEATSGSEAERPAGSRAVVRYEDRWQWDMRMYLIFFRADLRDVETEVLLATAQSYQPSLEAMGQSYKDIVADVVRELVSGELRP